MLCGCFNSLTRCVYVAISHTQVPSSPPPLAAPVARRLSISASVTGEDGLMSCLLPEELLVEILAERMQVNSGMLVTRQQTE